MALFDINMGLYDGSEVCKMVDLFFQHQLALLIGKNNIGLYRDDGLAIPDNVSGFKSESESKIIQDYGLKNNSQNQPRLDRFSRHLI